MQRAVPQNVAGRSRMIDLRLTSPNPMLGTGPDAGWSELACRNIGT
jgi:hypothetical protein